MRTMWKQRSLYRVWDLIGFSFPLEGKGEGVKGLLFTYPTAVNP